MPLTWGLFPTLVTSLGPGAAARDRRAPSAFAPGSQRPGLVRHGQKGRFPQGTGQELPCPARKSSPCHTATCLHRQNILCHLTKIPSVLLECCSPRHMSRSCAVATGELPGCLGEESVFVLWKGTSRPSHKTLSLFPVTV